MKRIIFVPLLSFVVILSARGQEPERDLRTDDTKIADLLAQLPAQNTVELDRIIGELFQFGGKMITDFACGLVPPGGGDDSRLRYAISGMVKYASSGEDAAAKKICTEAICRALDTTANEEVKDFLLQELQYVAGDEAVPAVVPYLADRRLSDPATRVLIRINTVSSNQAIMERLRDAASEQQINMVQALGKTRYTQATGTLDELASSAGGELKKANLRALAEIGDPSSAKLLASEAEKTGYAFDPTGATEAYLLYLRRSAQDGNVKFAARAAGKLVRSSHVPQPARIAAVKILSELDPEKALPFWVKAVESGDRTFRMAALSVAGNIYGEEVSRALRDLIVKTENPDVQADILYALGAHRDSSAFSAIEPFLFSPEEELQLVSVEAAAKTGGKAAIGPLLELMKQVDQEHIPFIKSILLTVEGDEVPAGAAATIPATSGRARIALIEIVAARKDDRHAGVIFSEAVNTDPEVRLAAAHALSAVAHSHDAAKISGLLNEAEGDSLAEAFQAALFTAVNDVPDEPERVKTVKRLMERAGKMEVRYYPVLARLGGHESLEIVEHAYTKGKPEQKEEAMDALCNWGDFSALDLLFEIAGTGPVRDAGRALDSYISRINASPNTSDQKVLMFREAMGLAREERQQVNIIDGISRNNTLHSMVFVSKYLDHPILQQPAVQAVRKITLNSPSLFGDEVEGIILKAISVNTDPEADYQKQALLDHLGKLPEGRGYVPMFNGRDLEGWKGLVENPLKRKKMSPGQLAVAQGIADEAMHRDWVVGNGLLVYEGAGFENLCSERSYADFELILDWKTAPGGDGGIYLRGTPQVQIWDTSRTDAGAQVGSGGLYNNKTYRSTPLVPADNPSGDWNTFRIKMIGDRVTVHLNGVLVTDNVILENYWDRSLPIFKTGPVELQAHASRIQYRDIYIREIPRPEPYTVGEAEAAEGFIPLFNGIDLSGWTGNKVDYFAQEGMLVCNPTGKGKGNLFTERKYSDFILRFEFQLTPGANNGLGIRAPLWENAAYAGMELQILDNSADIYKNLRPYQYHGSVYGVIPARRGFQKPPGDWNYQEVQAIGTHIRVILNGTVILEGDIAGASKGGTETLDGKEHPGLLNPSGHIGFLGHGSALKFRNIRIREIIR